MGKQGGGEVSDAEWRAFLETEVTPRFPDGLTVLTAYGQWRSSSGELARETSRVAGDLVSPRGRQRGQDRGHPRRLQGRFGQESVMRVDGALVRVVLRSDVIPEFAPANIRDPASRTSRALYLWVPALRVMRLRPG